LYAQTKNPLALEMADALLIGNKAGAEKEAYFIKGLYFSFRNEKEKSIIFFDKSLAISYTFMEAYLEKAIALYDLKKYNESIEVLKKAVTVQNNFDRGYYYLGRNFEKLNQPENAADAYQTALMYDPDYAEAKDALSKLGR
jgi:tetratricopeptide (TPR) repeat protein